MYALASLIFLATGVGIAFAPRYVSGVTTALSIPFNPIPATFAVGLNIPYLKPRATGLPISEKPPPIVAPSAPYLNLFLNLASAKSLPDKLSVFSCFKTKDSLSGSAAIKSVAPAAVAI